MKICEQQELNSKKVVETIDFYLFQNIKRQSEFLLIKTYPIENSTVDYYD